MTEFSLGLDRSDDFRVYIQLFFFHNEFFLFWGGTALDVRIEERKEEKERRREGEREVEVAYTLQIHKSPYTTACLCAYIPFVFPVFSSFFFLLPSSLGENRSAMSVSSARVKRKENQGGGTKPRREGEGVVDV